MTREEQEINRHNEYQEAINKAKTIEELPEKYYVSHIKNILKAELNRVARPKGHFQLDELTEVAQALILDKEYINSTLFIIKLRGLLANKTSIDRLSDEMNEMTSSITNCRRLVSYLCDMRDYDEKFRMLSMADAKVKHDDVMSKIANAKTVKELPNTSSNSDIRRQITQIIKGAFKKECLDLFRDTFDFDKTIKAIAEALVSGLSLEDKKVYDLFVNICTNIGMVYPLNLRLLEGRCNYLIELLKDDYSLEFSLEELRAKNARILKIYEEEHDRVMESIKYANRISEMPKGLSVSKITDYLSRNSVLYKNTQPIPAQWFEPLAKILLQIGLDYQKVHDEIDNIVSRYLTEMGCCRGDMRQDLENRISKLPRLPYYVSEVRYAIERQEEFILRDPSKVKVYIYPSDKSPVEGGKFYCIYISRNTKLKLDIDKIVANAGKVEDLEKYIKENFDPTFKAAGGIILNKDERIDRNVYTPDDGSIGISPEAKANYTALEDLSTELNALLEANKKALEENEKQQTEFKKQQAQNAEEIGKVQSKINTLVKTLKAKEKKEDQKEEEK